MELSTKKEVRQKEKKKQKKKNVPEDGKLCRVSHIPARQTNNKYLIIIFRMITCIVHPRINNTCCKVITGFITNLYSYFRTGHN